MLFILDRADRQADSRSRRSQGAAQRRARREERADAAVSAQARAVGAAWHDEGRAHDGHARVEQVLHRVVGEGADVQRRTLHAVRREGRERRLQRHHRRRQLGRASPSIRSWATCSSTRATSRRLARWCPIRRTRGSGATSSRTPASGTTTSIPVSSRRGASSSRSTPTPATSCGRFRSASIPSSSPRAFRRPVRRISVVRSRRRAGCVFIGATKDARFRAYDAKTGKELWYAQLEAAGAATPMTFMGTRRQAVRGHRRGRSWRHRSRRHRAVSAEARGIRVVGSGDHDDRGSRGVCRAGLAADDSNSTARDARSRGPDRPRTRTSPSADGPRVHAVPRSGPGAHRRTHCGRLEVGGRSNGCDGRGGQRRRGEADRRVSESDASSAEVAAHDGRSAPSRDLRRLSGRGLFKARSPFRLPECVKNPSRGFRLQPEVLPDP